MSRFAHCLQLLIVPPVSPQLKSVAIEKEAVIKKLKTALDRAESDVRRLVEERTMLEDSCAALKAEKAELESSLVNKRELCEGLEAKVRYRDR